MVNTQVNKKKVFNGLQKSVYSQESLVFGVCILVFGTKEVPSNSEMGGEGGRSLIELTDEHAAQGPTRVQEPPTGVPTYLPWEVLQEW